MVFPQTSLPARFYLDLNGTGQFQTEITSSVQLRSDVEITRGRPDESGSVEPATCSLRLNNRTGNFSPRNPNGAYYGQLVRNTAMKTVIDQPTSWLVINQPTGPTLTTCYVSTPDTAALDITGDVDLRFDADLDSWREAMELVSKWDSGGNQRSYDLELAASGTLVARVSSDGSSSSIFICTVLVPVVSGRLAVRATVDVDNGAGGKTCTFYYSDTINGTWIQLGDPVIQAGTTTVFAGTSALYLLDNPNFTVGLSVIRGRVYAAQVRNGINGTVVANPDFTGLANLTFSFTDSTGKLWTNSGNVYITNQDTRHIGEIPEFPVSWDISGRDVYTDIQASDIFRRLQQGDSPLQSALYRGITGLTGSNAPTAYWPLEDQGGSTLAASGIGGPSMTTLGGPNFGSFDDFKCSSPVVSTGSGTLNGAVPVHTSTGNGQVTFLMAVPVGGITNLAPLVRIYISSFPLAFFELSYGTGGSMTLTPYVADNAPLATVLGPIGYAVDGKLMKVAVDLKTSGSDITMQVTVLEVGQTVGQSSPVVTVTGQTMGRITRVQLNPKLNVDVPFGHLAVYKTNTSIFTLATQLNAFTGETAGRRIERLCSEEGVSFQGFGDLDDTVMMGAQTPEALIDLLKECAFADTGILSDSRAMLGVAYRPKSAIVNQTPAVTLPYTSLSNLQPVEDDQHTRNDITVTRTFGSSFRATLLTGALSVQNPPNGVGIYDDAQTVNIDGDNDLPDQAGWRLHLGTVDEPRYPEIYVGMENPRVAAVPATVFALNQTDLGDRLVITGAPVGKVPPGDVSQLIQGLTEVMNESTHNITYKCTPYSPWLVGTYLLGTVTPASSRYMSDGTVLSGTLTTTATAVGVTTASGPVWDTTASGFDIVVGGEQMTVQSITGTGTGQTFNVIRSVNGIVKTHQASENVVLALPAYYSL